MVLFLHLEAEEWECHNDPPTMRGGVAWARQIAPSSLIRQPTITYRVGHFLLLVDCNFCKWYAHLPAVYIHHFIFLGDKWRRIMQAYPAFSGHRSSVSS
jgi:hypothetical protein